MKKNVIKSGYAKLHATKLGLAGGILTGVCVFITTMLTFLWGYFPIYTGIIVDIYGLAGFTVSPLGAVLGAIYGFIDGFIIVWLFALLYNKFL